MELLKQAFVCANTEKFVAALEMVLCIWHISLTRDLGRISVECVKKCVTSWLLAWKIEDIWMPLTICFHLHPSEKWAALFWPNALTLLMEASAVPVPAGHPGPGAVALLGLWGAFWNYSCSPLLPFSPATLHPSPHISQSCHRHRKEEKPDRVWPCAVVGQ